MKVQFGRCTSNKLKDVPISDGQILFIKDTFEQYIDVNSSRIKITDICIIPDLEARDQIVNPSSNKLYYIVKENSIQFYCNGNWQMINYVDMENILTKDNTTEYTPVNDYNPATKKYVDDLVNSKATYNKTFISTDWVLNGQDYELVIPQSEHKLALPYVLTLEALIDGEYRVVNMFGSKLLPNGSLVIISDLQYDGRVVLKGNN